MDTLQNLTEAYDVKLLSRILQNSLCAFILLDSYGKIIEWSKEAARIFGWKRREVIGMSLFEVIIPESNKEIYKLQLKRISGDGNEAANWRRETIVVNSNGDEFYVELMITQLKYRKNFFNYVIVKDISETKNIERLLMVSNVRLSESLLFGKMGRAELDLLTGDIAVSKELLLLLDVETDSEWSLPLQDFISTYVCPEYLPLIYEKISEGASNSTNLRKDVSAQFQMVTATGRKIWIEAKGIFKGSKALGILQDVTERKLNEIKISESNIALQKERDKFQLLVDSIDGIVWQADSELAQFTYISKQVERIIGYNASEVTATKNFWKSKIHPEDKKYLQKGGSNVQYRFKHKIGGWRWLNMHKRSAIMGDGSTIWNGLISDITEQKEAQLKLQFARFTIDNTSDCLLWIRPDGSIEDINPAAHKSLGYSYEEMMKLSVLDIDSSYSPDMWVKHWKELQKKKSLNYQSQQRRKDGVLIDVEINSNYIDFEGQVFNCAFVRDITERKKHEKALIASNQEKDALIKEIHHRVKNNLQLISSILYVRMNNMHQQTEMKEFLEGTRQKIRSIALIHERLLQTGSIHEVDISDYLGKLISDLHMTSVRQDLTLLIDTKIEPIKMNLDMAIYCGLIINELVTNSIKHAFTNRSEGRIEISLMTIDNAYQLKVRDDGTSVPKTVTIGQSGSFGMQLLDIFVKQLRGSVNISRDNGTCFKILFK